MGKSKFKVGDKVRFKDKRNGKDVYTIFSVMYDEGDQRNKYVLKEKPQFLNYSYELEKVDESKTAVMSTNRHCQNVILEFDQSPFKEIDPNSKRHLEQISTKITVDDTVVKNRYGDTDIVEKTVKLTLQEAQKMYKAGGLAKEFALRVFTEDELNPKPKYPHTWDEYCNDFYPFEKHMHYTPEFAHGFTKEDCNALIAYGRLIRLRKAWIGDWRPDWESEKRHNNWVINYELKPKREETGKGPRVSNWGFMYHIMPLSFPTEEMANKFLSCFKDLLEKAKGLY